MDGKQSFWTTLPGILTGIAGLITAIGGFLIILNQLKTPQENLPERGGPKSTQNENIPDAEPTSLEIRSAAVPHDLRPNTVYDISIMVLSEKGMPVINARVEIRVGGGSFTDTGNFTTIGNTDKQGVFKTQWKSLESIPMGYGFIIQARKNSLTATSELSINYSG
jgi:hypothetical protein